MNTFAETEEHIKDEDNPTLHSGAKVALHIADRLRHLTISVTARILHSGAKVALHREDVDATFVPYIAPSDNGNRAATRWAALMPVVK